MWPQVGKAYIVLDPHPPTIPVQAVRKTEVGVEEFSFFIVDADRHITAFRDALHAS